MFIESFTTFIEVLPYFRQYPNHFRYLKENLEKHIGRYMTYRFLDQNNKISVKSNKLREEYERIMKRRGKKEKYKKSTNKNKSLVKNADKISDQHYKDALLGLDNSDPLLKEFYKGMQAEYDRRAEPRDVRTNLYGSREEQDITNMAHPKSVKVSDSIKDGGLVENGHEQQKKSLEVSNKNPTGNFIGNYAWMRKYLIK